MYQIEFSLLFVIKCSALRVCCVLFLSVRVLVKSVLKMKGCACLLRVALVCMVKINRVSEPFFCAVLFSEHCVAWLGV